MSSSFTLLRGHLGLTSRSIRQIGTKIERPRKTFGRPDEAAKGPPKGTGYFLLIIPISTFGLGVWQVQRRAWKEDLLAELDHKTNQEPVRLPDTLEELDELEYCRVKCTGTYDHSRESLLGPRSNLASISTSGGLFGSQDSTGWHVITPFKLSDRNAEILVNRGWVPRQYASSKVKGQGQVQGEVEVTGVIRMTETRKQFQPKSASDLEGRKFTSRDIPEIAMRLGTSPVFIDADAKTSTLHGGPLGGQTRINLPNDHFSYLVTWFSLSGATFWMWLKKFKYL